MKFPLKMVIVAAGSFILGVLSAKSFLEQEYYNRTTEEIEEIKRFYEKKYKLDKERLENTVIEEQKVVAAAEALTSYQGGEKVPYHTAPKKTEKDEKKGPPENAIPEETSKPITAEEFLKGLDEGFEQVQLMYYIKDNTLATLTNIKAGPKDRAKIFGNLSVQKESFWGSEGVVYLRNEALNTDYEIMLNQRETFAETVGEGTGEHV
jgi:hypothetical protein